ncbi:FAD-dependent oxidoreductase [Acetobacter aceti]|uniref:FAD/NAD(P)-binding oxidoreductase n=1 Tax=Acetobacter aceti TaxID=435 RepID=A0A6S6PEY7_ACEAC|nr:FAD-dependent oxidoreductase [Acetobacter aceti]BCI65823.1 FAD/NAD(P)-binding oxidoreductase [Acetobacter aceti]
MSDSFDLVVIGAGPAGISAALTASDLGLRVAVIEEHFSPGGQVWRGAEGPAAKMWRQLPGVSAREASRFLLDFRRSDVRFFSQSRAWEVTPSGQVLVSDVSGTSFTLTPRKIIFATGAQERTVPFRGWTLPGVMTVGAGQILLKGSGVVPREPVWLAGHGPLVELYAIQLLVAGGRIAGVLQTGAPVSWSSVLRALPEAILQCPGQIAKGLARRAMIRLRRVQIIPHVQNIEAFGSGKLEAVSFMDRKGVTHHVDAAVLMVHEGLIPGVHPVKAIGGRLEWDDAELFFRPVLDEWGESTVPGLFVVGDAARIGGADAALHSGALAVLRIATQTGHAEAKDLAAKMRFHQRRLRQVTALRPLVAALSRLRLERLLPADDVTICRCESVDAGTIRRAFLTGYGLPDQVKAFTRAGMGACQGRQCALPLSLLLSSVCGRSISEHGLFRARAPFKPLTLGELAALSDEGDRR